MTREFDEKLTRYIFLEQNQAGLSTAQRREFCNEVARVIQGQEDRISQQNEEKEASRKRIAELEADLRLEKQKNTELSSLNFRLFKRHR